MEEKILSVVLFCHTQPCLNSPTITRDVPTKQLLYCTYLKRQVAAFLTELLQWLHH